MKIDVERYGSIEDVLQPTHVEELDKPEIIGAVEAEKRIEDINEKLIYWCGKAKPIRAELYAAYEEIARLNKEKHALQYFIAVKTTSVRNDPLLGQLGNQAKQPAQIMTVEDFQNYLASLSSEELCLLEELSEKKR